MRAMLCICCYPAYVVTSTYEELRVLPEHSRACHGLLDSGSPFAGTLLYLPTRLLRMPGTGARVTARYCRSVYCAAVLCDAQY
eukprot:797220-Rhodomonas_salina.2